MTKRLAVLWMLGGLISACGYSNVGVTNVEEETLGEAKGEEVWSPGDAPSLFTTTLEYRLDSLPAAGEAATIPWTSSYWPTYQDNVNYNWAGPGTDSPALK